MEKLKRMKEDKGFIAALDQSGGSTPKALKLYGIEERMYNGEEEMFDLIHKMRTRIIKSKSFTSERILGAILFEMTMDRKIDEIPTSKYLLQKGILPFLKVDKGLKEVENGVQLMKDMPELEKLLDRAVENEIFGTKMRSVIKEYNEEGIKKVVKQQFEIAEIILSKGLVPIIEPEVDINSKEKEKIEEFLNKELLAHLNKVSGAVMLKLTLPTKDNLYFELTEHINVVRVVALSGGYSREESNRILSKNKNVIASFSRALTEGLSVNQTDEEFDEALDKSIESIYRASIS